MSSVAAVCVLNIEDMRPYAIMSVGSFFMLKKRKLYRLFCAFASAVLCALLAFAGGCVGEDGDKISSDGKVAVTISDGETYVAERSHFVVERGSDLSVRLTLREGFSVTGCSYADHSYSQNEEKGVLTLHNILYPAFVTLETAGEGDTIYYDLNGGELTDGNTYFVAKADVEHHLRANTHTGENVVREGYSLTGWNTRPDAGGTHIGLGSRVTVGDEGLILYAEWRKESELSLFEYRREGECVALTGYCGPKETDELVIPDEIDGVKVVSIAAGFASGVDFGTLVLPRHLREVEAGAFTQCTIDELYMSDGVEEISDASFGTPIARLHINAVLKPRYQTGNEIAWFADMMDKLLLAADHKKLVFFGGCSFAYGLDSGKVYERYGGEYEVFNMGIIGGTNATFQMQCILSCLGEGDVLVHAPEVGSSYQLLYNTAAEHRMFVMTEGNYDLLAMCDLSGTEGVFDSFATYNRLRLQLPEGEYSDYIDAFNEFGDIARPRPGGEDVSYTPGYTYEKGYLTQGSMSALYSFYSAVEQRGAGVLFTFSPVNWHGLTREERNGAVWQQFEDVIRPYLEERGVPVVSAAGDYCMYGRYFYDTDYHLNDEGVALRTDLLLRDMADFL